MSFTSLCQVISQFDVKYEIKRTSDILYITEPDLKKAITLSDLNEFYKPTWVKEYKSVVINTIQNGKILEGSNINDTLSHYQKKIMKNADTNTGITVVVEYLPNNALKQNDIKSLDFTIVVSPEKDATFPDGDQALDNYLRYALDKIDENVFEQYQLTAIKFEVDQTGDIIHANIFESSDDATVDSILLDAICKMPKWRPAQYANGIFVNQNFVLMAGDMNSCTINLLDICK